MKIGSTKLLRSLLTKGLLSFCLSSSAYSTSEVYLITTAPSDEIATVGGHVVIRVKDPTTATDLIYSWGNFDADYFLFYKKLFQGTLADRFEIENTFSYLAIAQQTTPRVVQYRVNLKDRGKQKLLKQFAWWAKPKNSFYLYEAWLENCSTHVRDVLDEALDHRLQKEFRGKASAQSFRDILNQVLSPWPLIGTGVDLLFNERLDRNITVWEEVFLPERLVSHLERLGVLSDPEVLFEKSNTNYVK